MRVRRKSRPFPRTARTRTAFSACTPLRAGPSAYKCRMEAGGASGSEPRRLARRRYGTGSVFQKRGAWYGQWRVRDRIVSRKLGPVRVPGSRDGLTKTMAEARLRKLMGEVALPPVAERITVTEAGERLIRQLSTRVARSRRSPRTGPISESIWGLTPARNRSRA